MRYKKVKAKLPYDQEYFQIPVMVLDDGTAVQAVNICTECSKAAFFIYSGKSLCPLHYEEALNPA